MHGTCKLLLSLSPSLKVILSKGDLLVKRPKNSLTQLFIRVKREGALDAAAASKRNDDAATW